MPGIVGGGLGGLGGRGGGEGGGGDGRGETGGGGDGGAYSVTMEPGMVALMATALPLTSIRVTARRASGSFAVPTDR